MVYSTYISFFFIFQPSLLSVLHRAPALPRSSPTQFLPFIHVLSLPSFSFSCLELRKSWKKMWKRLSIQSSAFYRFITSGQTNIFLALFIVNVSRLFISYTYSVICHSIIQFVLILIIFETKRNFLFQLKNILLNVNLMRLIYYARHEGLTF